MRGQDQPVTRIEEGSGLALETPSRLSIARHFQALVDSSHDAILSKSLEGLITSWNRAAERLYGYSSEEAVGQPISMIIPPKRAGEEQAILRRIRQGEEIDHFETERVRKDGHPVYVSLTVSPLLDERDELVGASVIARDITARRRGEERARRLREVASALSTTVTPEGVIDVVLKQALPIVEADAATFALVSPGGDELELVASSGHLAGPLQRWRRTPIAERLPLTDAVRTREPVFSESPEALVSDYPVLGATEIRFSGLAAIPLLAEGRALGAISLSFLEPHDFSADERAFLASVAHEAAQALARSELYERERRARREAETAREQLAFLARASEVLAESLDPTQTLRRLAELAVTRVADWCAVDLLEGESIENVVVAHRDADKVALATELRRRYPPDPRARTGLANVLRTGRSEVYSELSDESLVRAAMDEDHLELMRSLDMRAAMIVPLRARGRTLGGLTFVSSSEDRTYTEDDLAFAEDLARRAALALDNARHYRHEREVAISLQESLLPQSIPDLPGAEVATRYLSGTRGVEVGGDWYDVFSSGHDTISLVMGDVAGRGVAAASVMGQLRTAIRSYELEGHPPAAIVARVNRLAHSLTEAVLATLVYVRVDHSAGSLTIVNAGHPPVLMRHADGSADFAGGKVGEPISMLPESGYDESTWPIEPGSTLVMYTDGLIERRGEPIDTGLERLRRAVADGPAAAGELADHLLGRLLSGSERPDDVAVLVANLTR